MSVTVRDDLIQGSDEWLQARCGLLTASVIGNLITPATLKVANNETARSLTRHLTAERITGRVEESWQSRDMLRGTLDEPYARDAYAEWANTKVDECGLMILDTGTYRLGYSTDGLVGDDGLIEIKSRRQKTQLSTILDDAVPLENVAQIQTALFISGRTWCDYISYAGGMHLYVRRVTPDERWFDAIDKAATKFEEDAANLQAKYAERVKGMPITTYIDHFAEPELVIS